MDEFKLLTTFRTHPDLHDRFRSKDLVLDWAKSYPMLFDEDDLRIAENQAHMGYHFYEWLAAVLIYHTYGYLSLVEQYEFKSHKHKQQILQRLTTSEVIEFIVDREGYGNVQCPDLLVYAPDYSDWSFCEVKGPKDKLSDKQVKLFQDLAGVSGKPVWIVKFEVLAIGEHGADPPSALCEFAG